MNSPISPERDRLRLLVAFAMLGVALGLGGCQSTERRADDLDEPIFGSSGRRDYAIATSDKIHARDLAAVARILRRYKALDATERALVRSAVAKRLQALIALEVRRVATEPEFRARRTSITRIPDRKLAAARASELDAAIQAEAARRLYRRLGGMVATGVHGPDNKSAVAFARIRGERIAVEETAYEIDTPIASLTDGSRIQRDAKSAATLLGGPPVAVTASEP